VRFVIFLINEYWIGLDWINLAGSNSSRTLLLVLFLRILNSHSSDTSDNRCTTARPHHTDTATAPLATSTTTCRLQDRCPGFPVFDSSGTWLPSRRLSSRRRRQRSSTLISSHRDLCRHTSNIFGDWCFTAAGPQLWNSLPISLTQCHSLEQFKRLLKTLLFSAWSHGALWHLRKSAPYINPLTYLLTYSHSQISTGWRSMIPLPFWNLSTGLRSMNALNINLFLLPIKFSQPVYLAINNLISVQSVPTPYLLSPFLVHQLCPHWKSQIAHSDASLHLWMHHSISGVNSQIHSVSLASHQQSAK